MWWNGKTTRQRRIESRKRAPRVGPSPWTHFRGRGGLRLALFATLLSVVTILLDAWPADPLPYRVGQYLAADVYARVDFDVPSERLLNEQLESTKTSTPSTLQLNVQLVGEIMARLSALPGELSATTQPSDPNLVEQFSLAREGSLAAWRAFTQPANRQVYEDDLELFRAALIQTPIVRQDDLEMCTGRFHMVSPGGRVTRHVSELVSLDKPDDYEYEAARLARLMPETIRGSVQSYLVSLFRKKQPLYRYNAAATQQEIEARRNEILADPPKEAYAEGERLARRSRRQTAEGEKAVGLTSSETNLLRAEHRAYLAWQKHANPYLPIQRAAGRVIIVLLVSALLWVYIWQSQSRVLADRWRGLALAALLALMLCLCKLMTYFLGWNPHVAIMPVLMATAVATIVYEQRFAFVLGAVLSVLVVLQLHAGVQLLMVLFSGMMATAFLLQDIRRRSKLIEVAAAAAALAFLAVWAGGLASATPLVFTLGDGLWAAGFAVLVGFIIQGVLPLIERVFGVATSLTLLEWCDASKPLLKRLAVEAPGTYNHCLQLGTMCEAAAEAIGARGLLARVGAYYHDIGKINKPEYFTENQTSATSKHAKLSPAMSLLIIIGHVKDGLELARQYGLPSVLHEFIVSHHGTTLVQYFYQAATEQRKAVDHRLPDEVEFRYPGPKPHSKECAILMLADVAESSVRSMSEPTPGRIENQVHTMINRRLMDGQLDECDLTLREVHEIEASLVRSLCTIHHSRVSYPTPRGERPSAAELLAAKQQAEQAEQAREAADKRRSLPAEEA